LSFPQPPSRPSQTDQEYLVWPSGATLYRPSAPPGLHQVHRSSLSTSGKAIRPAQHTYGSCPLNCFR
jgi:hypothetical protein